MKNRSLILFALLPFFMAASEGVVCEKCQKIREYNVAHPENNITWYEDYQKSHPEAKPTPTDEKSSPKILLAGCGCGGKGGNGGNGGGSGDTKKPRGSKGT